MSDPKDRRKFENVLREPLTRQRLMLNGKIRAAQDEEKPQHFTFEELQKFIGGIRDNTEEFKQEALNVLEAASTGKAPQEPKFDTPEKQLAWGAALAYLSLNPEQLKTWTKPPAEGVTLTGTDLWKQVSGTEHAYQELLSHAHHVREALRDKDTKYAWGDPGTGFTFDRNKNLINIDFMQSMIVGFEHARADVYREIGHSLLSVTYPKRMKEVFKEMQPLMKKSKLAQMKKGPKLKPEEYKKLTLLSTEWQLRHMLFSAAEENVANKFVSNMGQQVLQDYGVSLNNTAVTHRGIGLTRLPADGMSDELRRYMNLCNTVQLSFFQNNDLFDNTDTGWFKVGVDPNLVRKTSTLKANPAGDEDGIAHPDFVRLRELCGGPKGLENLQPKQHERLFGWANLKSRVERADGERKEIIEEIWRDYAEELIQKILQMANDQIDENLDKAQKDPKNQKKQDAKDLDQDQDQDGDEGDDGQDGQDGQEGQEGDDGQEGQGQGKGKGKPQKGKKGKKQRGKPQGEQDDADSDDADGDDQDGQEGKDGQEKDAKDGKKGDKKDKDKGKKGDKKDKGKKGDKKDKGDKGEKGDEDGDEQGEGQDGQDEDGQDADADGDQRGKGKKGKKEGKLGQDDEETVPVEGAGDQPAPKGATELPSDELDPNGEGKDADGEDADGEDADGEDADGEDADGEDADGQTADDLEKELEKKKKKKEKGQEGDDADGQDGEDGDGKGKPGKPGKNGKPSKQAGHGDGKSLEELSKLDWTDYQKRVSELSGPISRVRKLFKDVQERQLQRKRAVSGTLEILPENGEVKDRFNVEAHRNLTIKRQIGDVQEQDLKRFHTDEVKMVPTEIDIVIMIDGSGSMNGTPLNSALQAAAIMFEAASGKDMKMNVYVGMWGDSDPPMLITPGADRVEIGKQMARAQKGLNSGTDLAPAIKKVAKTIGEQRGKSGTLSGFTHVLIISDGDMFDADKSKERIKTMFEYSDKITFDTAIIGRAGTNMEKMAKEIKGNKSFQDVGVSLGSNPEEIPMGIVGLLLEKVKKTGSFTAVPNSQKRRAMNKAHNKMDPKP